MAASISAHIIAKGRGYICSQCGGFVRRDAQFCKHCQAPFFNDPSLALSAASTRPGPWPAQLVWGLAAGTAAGIRAGLIVGVLHWISPWQLGETWVNMSLAALSAFLIATLGMWLLMRLHPSELPVFLAGTLFAALPHPLFWLLCLAYYGANSELTTTSWVGLTFISLAFVGALTVPLSMLSTGWMWQQYLWRCGAGARATRKEAFDRPQQP